MPTTEISGCSHCQSYQPAGNSYPNRCGQCDNYTLNNYSEPDRLKKLVQQRAGDRILGTVQEVERFATGGTNWNTATIITNHQSSYGVFLGTIDQEPSNSGIVKDSEIFVFPVNPTWFWGGEHSRKQHSSLSGAQSEAQGLRTKLNSENPFLVIHPKCDVYTSFSNLVGEPYVKIDYRAATSDFQPLDIAWVKRANDIYRHVGVYVGNGDIVHIRGTPFNGGIGVRKTGWSEFLNGQQDLYRYHPIISFKHYKTIISQLVGAKDNQFREGEYNIKNRNCEHFANMIVLGINYSQQIEEKGEALQAVNAVGRATGITAGVTSYGLSGVLGLALAPVTGGASVVIGAASSVATGMLTTVAIDDTINNTNFTHINNNKGSTVNLVQEIAECDNLLGKKSDYETRAGEARVEQALPSQVSTSECRIM